MKPKITIITCTYNSEAHLSQTIESVRRQSYDNIEHLFIDGCSKDGTLEIIKSFYDQPCLHVGKDKGIYDAFNKGLKLATGDVVGFLHSDDVLADDDAIARVAAAFADDESKYDYYSSCMEIYDKDLQEKFAILGAPHHRLTWRDILYSPNYFAHPTVYVRREVLQQVGEFDLKYKVAADIDWLWRLERVTDKECFDPTVFLKFRGSGHSANNYLWATYEEFMIAGKRFGYTPMVVFTYLLHYGRRLTRSILAKLGLFGCINVIRKMIFFFRPKQY